jgi:hypothetical protein
VHAQEAWLVKAHEIMLGNDDQSDDAKWQRDEHADMLGEAGQLSAVRRAAAATPSTPESTPLGGRDGGGGAAAAAAAAAAPEVGGIDGDGSLSDDAGLLMMEQGQMVPGNMSNNPHLREIQRPEKFELDRVRGLVASSSRSTIILVTNRTAVPLRLTSQALAAGSWLDKHAPPMEIPPFTQVFFANVTSSASLVSHTEPPN